jgi:hypothetical protein
MANPYWDGKVHKAVKFGDPFDQRTVEGRKRAMRQAIQARRAKAEVEFLGVDSPKIPEQIAETLPGLLFLLL